MGRPEPNATLLGLAGEGRDFPANPHFTFWGSEEAAAPLYAALDRGAPVRYFGPVTADGDGPKKEVYVRITFLARGPVVDGYRFDCGLTPIQPF